MIMGIFIDQLMFIIIFVCLFFRESELIVDDPVKYSEKIPVFINITLLNTKCDCKLLL